MTNCKVTFEDIDKTIEIPSGSLLIEAARIADIDVVQPCGGQGRCGRCIVQIKSGRVRRRSELHLSREDLKEGYVLACQTVVEGDVTVRVPPQEKIERKLSSDRIAREVAVPVGYDPDINQTARRISIQLTEPSLEDQTDDFSRLSTAIKQKTGEENIEISLTLLKDIGNILRKGKWEASIVLDKQEDRTSDKIRIVDILPGRIDKYSPLWGIAVDIGTTTVTVWLVNLITGKVKAQVSEYNHQISRGEDVISRIIYSMREGGMEEMRNLVLKTINELIELACKRIKEKLDSQEIIKATISGNSTMIHLLLGIPAENIRLAPYITAVNRVPIYCASEVGLNICSQASVECLPGVASYVGSDITAGVYATGIDNTDALTLFMDVGTNGEIVLGSRQWLVTCACSAGPAFEGAGVSHGMRATKGAIEEIWINNKTYEPTYRVIGGNAKPKGICGSGLLSLISEMFMTGLIDRGGNINMTIKSPRLREGKHGPEYVVVWEQETEFLRDITISRVDIDNLLRAKAAIYAGFTVLAHSVGIPLDDIEQIIIGGSFGKYINVEKAIQIGLLPDQPWDRYQFLGNTSVLGAYYALLDREARDRIRDIASRMTYIELSADNSFYHAFMSALFLPHTDINNFPSVAAALELINPPTKIST